MHFNFIWAVICASVGSGFQHGYNTGVVNPPHEVIAEWIRRSPHTGVSSEDGVVLLWSAAVAIFCIGGMIGGGLVGVFANKMGRKGGLIFNNFFALVAALMMFSAKPCNTVYLLIAGRFVIGLNCGLNAGLAPMYLSEISPTKIRGAVGSMYQLMITISIMIAQLLGLQSVLGSENIWHYLFLLTGVPAIIQLVGFLFAPESPKYYLEEKQNEDKATKALHKLNGDEDISNQFQEIKSDIESSKATSNVTIKDLFMESKLRKPLMILCFLMVAQQLSGINAVMFYSTHIFKMGNLSEESSQYSTLGVGIVNVLVTIVSVYLVEFFGRKTLLLVGFAGMFVSTLLLFIGLYFVVSYNWAGYACIGFVYIYVIFFASGAGSIPWLIGPELFNTACRPAALSLAVPTNWLFNFFVGIAFLPIQEHIGAAVFIIFIICQVLSLIVIWMFVPETKNKPIEEITALFQ
ncbi:hypothetical protein AAG570_000147 [Ranatra chinensis]|uniref:Major facilitator superfamily (MFS) profile domain-containing protein n=1 Tax=Ranatra chinensis TaxID=642074 RepID=A0ABD0YWI1_9HEMI